LESVLNELKRQYFDWRYWGYLYRQMKTHTEYQPSTKLESNSMLTPYINKPGIAFSIDDSFRVRDWYTYGKGLFGFYDVKVTFNINAFHHYEGGREHSQEEIDMLLDLQANGHELAHHGFKHKDVVKYSEQVGIEKFIDEEIEAMFRWMNKQVHSKTGEKFKKPVSFAYPHFRYNDHVLKALVPKYFKITRGHLKGNYLTPFNHTGFAPSICIDSHYLANPRNVDKVINFAKQSGFNLIFTCHSILPKEVEWDIFGWPMNDHERRWRTNTNIIQYIISAAKKNDLEFYTTAEMAGVATFIDHNFENEIRNVLSISPDSWIYIRELMRVKELDLSNQKISNLDGIQYFLNLEKLDLRNNNIVDYRLLNKLKNLVDIKM
jgi:peptidoglycan/xylan/chitin deacetylase (PgdA/CDA1 family)